MSTTRPDEPRWVAANARPDYLPLRDYALIGNTYSAALLGRDGSIDWFCLPHFDSPSVFGRLLDARQGGFFQVWPARGASCRWGYLPWTAVVESTWRNEQGLVRTHDYMLAPDLHATPTARADGWHRGLLKRLEGLYGTVELMVHMQPGFDYARRPATIDATREGLIATAGPDGLVLVCRSSMGAPQIRWGIEAAHARASLLVREGEVVWIGLRYLCDQAGGGDPTRADVTTADADVDSAADFEGFFQQTCERWRGWDAACSYRGAHHALVRTSARVLKLLSFGPSGALVAAPTSSLPEELGGERNWDYRCCWLRDSALMLDALLSIGHEQVASGFFGWLERVWQQADGHLQIMYRLDGGADLPEGRLDHLHGYFGSRPVRTGNGAAAQRQLGVYGQLLGAADVYVRHHGTAPSAGMRRVLRDLADCAAGQWREPDQGIWESRAAPQHHLSSKVMCWVALDRALGLARRGWLQGDTDRWLREARAVQHTALDQGFNRQRGCFTQVLGGEHLDASLLTMPLVGFIDARDPRMVATVDRIRTVLSHDGFVYRYTGPDGLAGQEGSFLICTCWMVENLALQGRIDEAEDLFERLTAQGSDLGLYAEELDTATGSLLGNYPQGYTHLGIIRAALAIERARHQA